MYECHSTNVFSFIGVLMILKSLSRDFNTQRQLAENWNVEDGKIYFSICDYSVSR